MTRVTKFLPTAFIAALLPGCASIEGTRTPDGTLTIRSTRFLWSTQKMEFSVNDGTNIVVTLRAEASGSDKETASAITDAAVTAAVRAVTGK